MLSRVVGRFGMCVQPFKASGVRLSSTAVTSTSRPRDKVVEDFENYKMPLAPYEGMGPLPPLPTWDPKCMRHYIVPEHWFEFLYPRTGVTGPYALAIGTSAFLISKEWYIYTPETWVTVCLVGAAYLILKKVGPTIGSGLQEMVERQDDALYRLKMDEMEHIERQVKEIKDEQWRSGLQELYHEVKKSNLALMLETEFLSRKASLVSAVKKKLDYQVAVQQVDRDLSHAHMVKWVEERVRKSITPESQRKTLDVCIAQLNAMSAK